MRFDNIGLNVQSILDGGRSGLKLAAMLTPNAQLTYFHVTFQKAAPSVIPLKAWKSQDLPLPARSAWVPLSVYSASFPKGILKRNLLEPGFPTQIPACIFFTP